VVEGASVEGDDRLPSIRNIGIMAHIDAGKTTVTERILYYSGRTRKIGEVHDGEAEMDWMELERERGITISSAATYCVWRNCQISIIDTPGHVDFTAEVERSLRVLDGAIGVFCGVAGVQSQSETVWRQADRYAVPRIVFVNKIDRDGARFRSVVEEVERRLGVVAVPIQVPLGEGREFRGIIDLVDERALVWEADTLGSAYHPVPIPDDYVAPTAEWRARLVEQLADMDDELAEKYLAGESIAPALLRRVLRRLTIANLAVPVLCGSALRNTGIQPLLDAVVSYLPSPAEVPPVEGVALRGGSTVRCPAKPDGNLAGLVFKVMMDQYLGRLVFTRVYSGRLTAGRLVYNPRLDAEERALRLFRMHANRQEEVAQAAAGDIVAVGGLKNTVTGDTLCWKTQSLLLEAIQFPNPVVSIAIEPRTKGDEERLQYGAARLAEEDPSFRYFRDPETGQGVLSGMGELHLDVVAERLFREYGVQARVGRPEVAYRETVTEAGEVSATFDREMRGVRHYAGLSVAVEPLAGGTGNRFQVADELGIPPRWATAIRQAVFDSLSVGPIGGYPVVDVSITVVGLASRPSDTTETACGVAASMATRNGLVEAKPIILEPVMKLTVFTPEHFLGEVLSSVTTRLGRIEGIEDRQGGKVVQAFVSLKNLFGYTTELRSLTQGRATNSIHFARYERAPQQTQQDLAQKARGTVV
jgi:elongation factor G